MPKSKQGTYLCLTSEILELGSKEFELDKEVSLFVIKSENQFYGYANNCPHANWPLNFQPNVFLNTDKTQIQCSNHMALFDKKTGECISGPCTGERLKKVDLIVINNKLFVKPAK